MLRFICLALMTALVSTDKLKFKDCGHKEVTQLSVSGCSGSTCVLYRNEDVTVEFDFVANQNTEIAKIETKAQVGQLVFELPSLDTDGCHYMKCPVKKGESKSIKYELTIPQFTPLVEANLTIKLVGDNGQMACAILPGTIKDLQVKDCNCNQCKLYCNITG